MRRPIILFVLCVFLGLAFLLRIVWIPFTLLFVNGARNSITKAELPAPGSALVDAGPHLIPKIIHQTYINESVPEIWQDAQASCLALHPEPDWQYILWTDETALEFITTEYPWFLDTFIGYTYPIQRADAIRYFVLVHFGGVYIDLDDGCNRRLEPLLNYSAFVRKTIPTGISNDVMGAVPRHPFFTRVVDELMSHDRHWVMPYISVMASTGPLFLSLVWRRWSADGLDFGEGPNGGRVRILFPDEYQGHSWSFFTHNVGNSWHGDDVQLIFWMGRHWLVITVIGFAMGLGVLFLGWIAYNRLILKSPETHIARWKTAAKRSGLRVWRRLGTPEDFEVVGRHDV